MLKKHLGVIEITFASAFRYFSKVFLIYKNIKLMFFLIFYGFNVLIYKKIF